MAYSNKSIVVGALIAGNAVVIVLFMALRTLPPLEEHPQTNRELPSDIAIPPATSGSEKPFADARQPVLKRQRDGETSYEIIGRFVRVPTLGADGAYTGQFAVTVGTTDVVLPVTLGRGTFTIFLGEHEGSTPGSPSKYSMKPVTESLPFFILKQDSPTVIRLKTKIDADIDPEDAQCGEYCQYLGKWLKEHGSAVGEALDGLMRGEQRPLPPETALFVTQLGFLQKTEQ